MRKPQPSTRWTDPRYETFVRENAPALGWESLDIWRAFQEAFGEGAAPEFNSFRLFCRRLRLGSHVIPPSDARVLTEDILRVNCKAALITSDWQVPFHDAEWAGFAFEIGKAFDCDLHVINGDFLDFHSIAKFDPQI